MLVEETRRRKEQIDEAVDIAKRVDVLRIKLADIQRQYDDYVTAMKLGLNKEIKDLTERRDELKVEVKELLEIINKNAVRTT